ncbi:MAG: stage II sporulation protein M [Brevinematales bacterium]|nr:stage II sporulation protein M [Brevinematales bacterium]
MKQLLIDAFGLIRTYKNVYLITALIFIIGVVIGMFGYAGEPFPLALMLNGIFGAEGNDFWITLFNSVKIAIFMLTFGVIVIIPLFITLFQGMTLGMTLMLLPKWTDGWTAAVYLVLTGILFYPAIILTGGNGAILGLKLIRQIKERSWSALLQETAVLTMTLVLPVLLLSALLRYGVASQVIGDYVERHTSTASAADAEKVLLNNGYFIAGRAVDPAGFQIFKTAFAVEGKHPDTIPPVLSFTNKEGMKIGVCYCWETNLMMVMQSNKISAPQNQLVYSDNGNPPLIEINFAGSNQVIGGIMTGLSDLGYRVWISK